ncbi:unnamed protein product [Parnassius apollo]|uniref:(apollo) hypothetical protein n=1 Tax=Parnassius apollo TaxID=110799 RepID=A0A8S3YC01_PARAO|nr:unnamed protein product [Parnassius apollo]
MSEFQQSNNQMKIKQSNEVDVTLMEKIVLFLAEEFNIRLRWNKIDAAVFTTVFGLIGAGIGGYNSGKLGAVIGAAAGGVTGLAVSTLVSLREVWESVKYYLKEIYYIIFNFLRRLDPVDYVKALCIFWNAKSIREALTKDLVDFIADKLACKVYSNMLTA